MSKRKKHPETDDNMKIYPDIVPGLSHSAMDTQVVNEVSHKMAENNYVRTGNDMKKNNRGWSK